MNATERRRLYDRARRAAVWTQAHAGHEITTQQRTNPSGEPYRWCLTCHGPLDVDPVAVERAVAGQRAGRLNPAERRAAVIQLRPRLSAARIASLLGVTDRTVWRDIAATRTTKEN